MELLQNLWNVLVTKDEVVTKYILFPFAFIEVYVTMKFFTTVLKIDYTNKQRNIYFGVMSIFSLLSLYVIPKNISVFMTLIMLPISAKLIFKTTTLKSIVAEIISMLNITFWESLYLNLCRILLNIEPNDCVNIPIFRILFVLLIYTSIFFITKFIKKIKFDFNIFDALSHCNKKWMLLNLIFIVIYIGAQCYLFIFYNQSFPIFITLITLTSLIIYTFISLYSLIKTTNLEITQNTLKQSQLHNKTLEILYNNMCAFKHDFSNIITAFGGFVYTKDMDGFEKYYNKVLNEFHINNNLSTLNPTIINNPAIYNILATKYYKADELGISIDLQIFIDLNKLKLDIYEFSRILAILLDNAIEAASACDEKLIRIELRDINYQHFQILSIQNTYCNKDINIAKLYEKGYTSKTEDKGSHGIGLWQVAKMVNKHNNIKLKTSKDDTFFTQDLIIYY